MAFELIDRAGFGGLQCRFQIGGDDFLRIWIQGQLEVLAAGIRMRVGEQTVVQAYFSFERMVGADPVQVALDLVVGAAGCAALAVFEVVQCTAMMLPSASLSQPVHSTT